MWYGDRNVVNHPGCDTRRNVPGTFFPRKRKADRSRFKLPRKIPRKTPEKTPKKTWWRVGPSRVSVDPHFKLEGQHEGVGLGVFVTRYCKLPIIFRDCEVVCKSKRGYRVWGNKYGIQSLDDDCYLGVPPLTLDGEVKWWWKINHSINPTHELVWELGEDPYLKPLDWIPVGTEITFNYWKIKRK